MLLLCSRFCTYAWSDEGLTTARVLSTKALMPKSAIFTAPPLLRRRFAGLMSRWTWEEGVFKDVFYTFISYFEVNIE